MNIFLRFKVLHSAARFGQRFFTTSLVPSYINRYPPRANPTIVSFNVSVVKIYNAMDSKESLWNNTYFSPLKKSSTLKFRNHRICSRYKMSYPAHKCKSSFIIRYKILYPVKKLHIFTWVSLRETHHSISPIFDMKFCTQECSFIVGYKLMCPCVKFCTEVQYFELKRETVLFSFHEQGLKFLS
jgi:hypothetical protein